MDCSSKASHLGTLAPAAGRFDPLWKILLFAPILFADPAQAVQTQATDVSSDSRAAAEVDDVAARMQYAYYTQDLPALADTLGPLEALTDGRWGALRDYYLAYGYWKLAELHLLEAGSVAASVRPRPEALAAQAMRRCIKHARAARDGAAHAAEAHALEAVCGSLRSRERSGGCLRRALQAAIALAPGNPRVRLIEARCAGRVAQPVPAGAAQAAGSAMPAQAGASAGQAANTAGAVSSLERWQAVVSRFESAAPSRPGHPDWGHVEALTKLGEAYLRRGESVAARNTLERALVLMPDHREAQALLRAAAALSR